MIVDQVRPLVGAQYAALGIVDADGGSSASSRAGSAARPGPRSAPLPRGHGLLGLIIRENRSFRIPDIAADPRRHGFPPNHPPMHSFLGVPVTVKGRSVGNLYLTDKTGAAEFSEDDQALVETFALHAGIAIENARLHEQVQRLAVVDERERICQDLHDGIIQNIYAVGLSLEDVPELMRDDPDEADRRVERAIDTLHLTIQDIRNFIFGLRPELLSGTTLIVGPGRARRGVPAQLDHRPRAACRSDGREPDPTDDGQLLGIVNEALSNIARHSGATRATSGRARSDGRPAAADRGQRPRLRPDRRGRLGHQGLANMRARAARSAGPWTSRASDRHHGSRSTGRPTEPTPTRRSPRR